MLGKLNFGQERPILDCKLAIENVINRGKRGKNKNINEIQKDIVTNESESMTKMVVMIIS